MTAFLPRHMLELFRPRPPIVQVDQESLPIDNSDRKYDTPLLGIAQYMSKFEDPKVTPPPAPTETAEQKRLRKKKEQDEANAAILEARKAAWNPREDPILESDAYKTLFVGRLAFDATEDDVRAVLDKYGPITSVCLVCDKVTGKSRGYAFVEFEHERDMRAAYTHADGMKIKERRIVVDIERGRTIDTWKPRKLGGGLGGTRLGGKLQNVTSSGRYDPSRGRRDEGPREPLRYDRRDDRGRDFDRRDDRGRDFDRRERDRGDRGRDYDRRDRDRGDRGRDHERRDRYDDRRDRRDDRRDDRRRDRY
eukprot:m.359325 g.359325  ORF g.359325 m.359325 type:complete len:307 (+) comp18532_c0_seq1:211-1131(+)